MGNRQLKRELLGLLKAEEFKESLEEICQFVPRQVVNPLFSFFYDTDEFIKWRAVTAMGAVVSRLVYDDIESARIIMRRLMWSLNDESGGIGWGSPEAMGEIMARNERLAHEYARILISYVNEGGNFIEHEMLQRGVLWGLGRLAHARPDLVKDADALLLPFMRSKDAIHRGLAAWTVGALSSKVAKSFLEYLVMDNTCIKIFMDQCMIEITVGQLAREALGE